MGQFRKDFRMKISYERFGATQKKHIIYYRNEYFLFGFNIFNTNWASLEYIYFYSINYNWWSTMTFESLESATDYANKIKDQKGVREHYDSENIKWDKFMKSERKKEIDLNTKEETLLPK